MPLKDRSREHACELGPDEWHIYQRYLECKAVGKFPGGDKWLRHFAPVIRETEDACRDAELLGAIRQLAVIVASKG